MKILRDIPRDCLFIGLASLAFLVVACAFSAITGAPFTVPTERMSRAIGVHYMVPFAIAIVGYCIAQALHISVRYRSQSVSSLKTKILSDIYFMILFVIVIYLHFHVKMWMPLINSNIYDHVYFQIDNDGRGLVSVFFSIRSFLAPFLPNVDYFYQAGFLAMFAFSLWFHSIGRRQYHYHNLVALLLLQMVGGLSYLVAPAVGPFIYEEGLNQVATAAQSAMFAAFTQVQVSGADWLAKHGGDYFTGPPAAMPSLHIAAGAIITYYALKARLLVSGALVFLFAWLVVESVASRWHYVIDLPPGLAVAFVVIVLTNRICANRTGAAVAQKGKRLSAHSSTIA